MFYLQHLERIMELFMSLLTVGYRSWKLFLRFLGSRNRKNIFLIHSPRKTNGLGLLFLFLLILIAIEAKPFWDLFTWTKEREKRRRHKVCAIRSNRFHRIRSRASFRFNYELRWFRSIMLQPAGGWIELAPKNWSHIIGCNSVFMSHQLALHQRSLSN